MMSDEAKTYGHLFEVDHDAALREKFASGQGVIELQPEMTDEMLLAIVKHAVSICEGKPFLVVPVAA
jgi:hypothetical protein